MNEYATLREMRNYLSLASQNTQDDDRILDFTRRASRAIDSYTRRKFYPERKIFKFDYNRSDEVRFDRDVLELKGLSDLNGASGFGLGVLFLSCGDDYNRSPYDRARVNSNSGSLFNYQGTTQQAIHADLLLGYHEDYDYAWMYSNGILTASLASAITTASVSASSGSNEIGLSPRYESNQLWKIGSGASEEFVYTKSFDGSSLVELIRGINGTVANDHASDTPVYVWCVEPEIKFATVRLAQWQYEQAQNPIYSKLVTPQFGTIEMPFTWPLDVQDKLKRFQRGRIKTAF